MGHFPKKFSNTDLASSSVFILMYVLIGCKMLLNERYLAVHPSFVLEFHIFSVSVIYIMIKFWTDAGKGLYLWRLLSVVTLLR